MTVVLPRLGASPTSPFPDPATALTDPNGLLAFGGDLTLPRLIAAYRRGIFPWFSPGEPILWWSPDPRCVFETDAIHRSRRLRRWLSRCRWRVVADHRFAAVIDACAAPRPRQHGTWIVPAMRAAYVALHRAGHAHSIEVECDGALVGGLYGVAVGRLFSAESMFSGESNASKLALLGLARRLSEWGWPLIDAQVASPHLLTLGARTIPRARFLARLTELVAHDEPVGDWRQRFGSIEAAALAA